MSHPQKPLPPLSLPRPDTTIKLAYNGDLLERKVLGERLTGYLDRLREGAVLAIDAPWGEGKTWFGRNWAKQLEDQEHKVIYIDAFAQDYVEDPFLLITAEIAEAFKSEDELAKGLLDKATGVMKAILPVGTKALINIAGRLVLGSADLSEDFEKATEAALEGSSDSTSKWVEKKLKDHANEKKSLQAFHAELSKFAAAQEKPVVLFIDELDRCRPSFAVRLIERIKHFFDVPNLVFVLLLNRDQLEKAVKGVYGPDTDARAYLAKFVHFFFKLPKRTSLDYVSNDHIKAYINHLVARYNFEGFDDYQAFQNTMPLLATAYNLSLREMERAVALYAFSLPQDKLHGLLAYIITLRIAKPELFNRLLNNEIQAHKEALEITAAIIQKTNETRKSEFKILTIFSELHEAHISNFDLIGDNIRRIASVSSEYYFDLKIKNLFNFLAAKIDLPIEN